MAKQFLRFQVKASGKGKEGEGQGGKVKWFFKASNKVQVHE